jgi:pimeloyl-ACP methyl ester carboxylesterase
MTGSETGRSTSPAAPTTGVAAGVPFIALPPGGTTTSTTPVVLAWHLMDPPRSEKAFAAALPLSGVDAWRIYFGLPMHGSRLPAGGLEELMRLAYEDVVLNLDGPIASQATAEFAPAFEELRQRFDLGSGPLAVVGGSLGSAIALLVLTESGVDFDAAVLLSPMVQFKRKVEV